MSIKMEFKFDDTELQEMLSSLKDVGNYVIETGVLAKDNQVLDSGKTLADIGSYCELGTSRSPARSFLRMPLELKKKEIVDFTKSVLTVDSLMNKKTQDLIGLIASNILLTVKEAFNTKGFGNWKDNAPSTIAAKGFNNPNIWTGLLKEKINTQVIKK